MGSLATALGRELASRARYESYRRYVEPSLTEVSRVHRFCAVPVVGDHQTGAQPVAVCVDPRGQGRTGVTRASVERQTLRAEQILEMPLERALGETRAPWVAVVGSGTRLVEHALERLAQGVTLAPGAQVVTCDDGVGGVMGRGGEPRLRPGPSPDLWLGRDPLFALMVVAREPARVALMQSGGDPYALFLDLSGPDGAGHAHVPMVLCHVRAPHGRPSDGPDGRVAADAPAAPAGEPTVEVIVCFRDRPALLERCARTLLERSSYERLLLRLVDNGSSDHMVDELLGRLDRHVRVTVDRDARLFNFSALNHAAAARSEADVLVFLNNDTEVVDPDWLEVLLEQALRPEVGAVAPLLTYPDGRVQHAGVAIGMHGWAGHPFAGLEPDQQTPFGAATDGTRNWMAVTAACMMVERRKYMEVGGFDDAFAVGGGDVDLCLRLTAAGHRSLCVPSARVIHDESATRDPARIPPGDYDSSRQSYGDFRTVGDPFYHPALTLQDTSCRLRRAGESPVPE